MSSVKSKKLKTLLKITSTGNIILKTRRVNMIWKIVNFLNDVLVNTLTTEHEEYNEEPNLINTLSNRWDKHLTYCSDEEIDRYLDKIGSYYNIECCGRYKCEKILNEYFSSNNIDVYKI